MNAFKKFELVDFYFLANDPKQKIMSGTLHVYFPTLDLDLRGIWIGKNEQKGKVKWKLTLPSRQTIDADTKQKVGYPIISFSNRQTQKDLEKMILEKAIPLIMEKLKKAPVMIKKPKENLGKKPIGFKKDFQRPKSSFNKMPLEAFVNVVR